MKRLLAVMALGTSLFAAVPGPVEASVGYATFSPPSASPGEAVNVATDSTNCPILDTNPSSVRMVLYGPDLAPDSGPEHDVILSRTGEEEYTFTVPSLAPGLYDVSIECWPGGGLEGIVTDPEGGEEGFRILPSAGTTSTAIAPATAPSATAPAAAPSATATSSPTASAATPSSPTADPPSGEAWPLAALVLLCAACVVGAALLVRRLVRR
jgi:hypothetical protein